MGDLFRGDDGRGGADDAGELPDGGAAAAPVRRLRGDVGAARRAGFGLLDGVGLGATRRDPEPSSLGGLARVRFSSGEVTSIGGNCSLGDLLRLRG